jgi:hypothetical protein
VCVQLSGDKLDFAVIFAKLGKVRVPAFEDTLVSCRIFKGYLSF